MNSAVFWSIAALLQFGGAAPPDVETSPVPSTRLYVRTIPPGATVTVDGQPIGTANGLFLVPAGVHKLTLELDGRQPTIQQVEVPEGRITRLEVELRRSSPGQRGGSGLGGGAPLAGGAKVQEMFQALAGQRGARGGGGFFSGGGGQGGGGQGGGGFFGGGGLGGVNPAEASLEARVVRLDPPPTDALLIRGADSSLSNRFSKQLSKTADLSFEQTPLSDVIEFVSEATQVPILLNERQLSMNGVSRDVPVTLSGGGFDFRSALALILEPLDLAVREHEGHLEVTTRDGLAGRQVNQVYDVSDLTRDPAVLRSLIYDMAGELSWIERDGAGGRFEVDKAAGAESLVISQFEPVHRRIQDILDSVRRMRGDAGLGKEGAIATAGYWQESAQTRKIRAALDQKISIDLVDVPLKETLTFLAEKSGVPIIIDNKTISDSGASPDSPVKCSLREASLHNILTSILGSLDLSYSVRHETILVGVEGELDQSLAFYPVQDLVKDGRTLADLIRVVERTVRPDSWQSRAEGDSSPIATDYSPELGDLYGIEGGPTCLVVRQSTAGHREVHQLLNRLRQTKR